MIRTFGAAERGWSERLENLVIEMNPAVGVDVIRQQVEEKNYFVHEVFGDTSSIGFLISRIDSRIDGSRSFVILHSLSEVKGMTPLRLIASVLLKQLAKEYRCKSVTCFSDRKGWDGILEQAGLKFRESIYEMEVEA